MMAASTYLPSTSSSTTAASSIQGTGAQNLCSARAQWMQRGIGHRVRAVFLQPTRASWLDRPPSAACGGLDMSIPLALRAAGLPDRCPAETQNASKSLQR